MGYIHEDKTVGGLHGFYSWLVGASCEFEDERIRENRRQSAVRNSAMNDIVYIYGTASCKNNLCTVLERGYSDLTAHLPKSRVRIRQT